MAYSINPTYVTASVGGSVPLQLINGSTVLIDSIQLYGSEITPLIGSGSTIPQYFFGTTTPFEVAQDREYTLKFDLACRKSDSSFAFDARVDVYLFSGAFPSNDPLGLKIATFVCPETLPYQSFVNQVLNFRPDGSSVAHLRFVIYSGQWYASNVSIKPSTEFGFNPSISKIVVPVTGYRNDQLQFKVDLFDVNNNLVNVKLISNPILFNGGNTVIRGDDNRIFGSLTVAPSGSGPVLSATASGSYIGIGFGSIPKPIDTAFLPNYRGVPIVTMFSGSTPFSGSSNPGVGFQIVDGSLSGSFLDYNTFTGRLRIRGEIEVLPGTPLSSSIAYAVSASSAAGSGGTSPDGTEALAQIQRLVNASGSFPAGTFINGYRIQSPVVVGNLGYFSSSFGVGDIAGGKGIVLTNQGYLDSGGNARQGPAIYIGSGRYAHVNTPFFVASGSDATLFSLSDKLVWNGSTLSIAGNITVTGGDAATQTYANTTASAVQGVAVNLANSNTLSTSASIANAIFTLPSGKINKAAPLGAGAGLYLDATKIGYYNSSAWTVYIQNDGQFYFGNAAATQYVQWNNTTLTVRGNITVLGGDAATQTYANATASGAQNVAISTAATDATSKANTAQTNAISSANTNTLNTSASIANAIFTLPSGKINKAAPLGAGSGLYLDSTKIGYYDSVAATWKVYIQSDGQFYFGGTTSANSLSWNGTALVLSGSIYATSGVFSGTVSSNTFTTTTATFSGGLTLGGNGATANYIQFNGSGGGANCQITNQGGSLGQFFIISGGDFNLRAGNSYDKLLEIRASSSVFYGSSFDVHSDLVVIDPTTALNGKIRFGEGSATLTYTNATPQFSFGSYPVYASSFFTTSTIKSKTNISPFTDSALDILDSVDIVNFQFKNQEIAKIGFIAENTLEILSSPKKDSLDHSNAIGLLIKGMQELRLEITQLKQVN